jgi:hypothetical protein
VTGDRLARMLTGLAVLSVAVIAAAVSFSHIDALALAYGYTTDTARLLPLSVDGLIVASSLTLLTEARAQRGAPGLARFGLILGIAGTLAANVAYGVHFGPVGALVNAWPAAAFITATEILVGQMRRAGGIPSREEAFETVAARVPEVEPVTVPSAVPSAVPGDVPVIEPVNVSAGGVPPASARRAQTVTAGRSRGRAAKAPERIFAAEIERGELPSLRVIKVRAKCGTDRARVIRDALAEILQEAPEAA